MIDGFSGGLLGDPGSYALVDFVPFTAEVYFRLLERVGETFWPWHGATLVLGLAAITLAWRGKPRIACALLAAPWAWVGIVFLGQRYAALNWAGGWFAGAFLLEAALLLLLAVTGAGYGRVAAAQAGIQTLARRLYLPRAGGLILAGFGVAAYPMIAPSSGFGPFQAETFGIHPDPTAVATLGIALVGLRGTALWLALAIPLLWCVITGVTLQVLGAPWAQVPLAGAVVTILLATWKTAHR